MRDPLTKKLSRHTLTVVGIYTVISILWILFSDQLVAILLNAERQTQAQSYKGIFFVLATAFFLFLLIGSKHSAIKELFNRLRNKMKTFRDTFEQAAVGIAHISPEDKWIRVNKKLCNMLGYRKQELKSLTLADIVHEDDFNKGKEKDRQLITGDLNSYVMKKRYITKLGDVLHAKITKSAIYNGQESPSYLIAIIEDISKEHAATEELKASIEQKNLLLREIHHRVKNNLAIISGLLELQAYNASNKKVRKLLQNSMMRIKSMALIHESFYQSAQTSYVVFDRYLNDFVEHIKTILKDPEKEVTVNLQCNSVKLDINQAIPFGLLINELVINAYVHAFPKQNKGTIDIIISESGKQVSLKVIDNGQGFPSDFDWESSTSLGATIIQALVVQLDGDLSFQSKEGAEFSLLFEKEDKSGSSSAISAERLS